MSKLPRRFVPVAGVARKQGLKVQRSHKSETPDAANFLDVSSRKCLNGRGVGGGRGGGTTVRSLQPGAFAGKSFSSSGSLEEETRGDDSMCCSNFSRWTLGLVANLQSPFRSACTLADKSEAFELGGPKRFGHREQRDQ
jgi:hypothetical protein